MKVSETMIASLSQNNTYFWRYDQVQRTWVVANYHYIQQSVVVNNQYSTKVRQVGWINIASYIPTSVEVKKQLLDNGLPVPFT